MFNQQILDDYFKIVYEMEDIAKEDLKLKEKGQFIYGDLSWRASSYNLSANAST